MEHNSLVNNLNSHDGNNNLSDDNATNKDASAGELANANETMNADQEVLSCNLSTDTLEKFPQLADLSDADDEGKIQIFTDVLAQLKSELDNGTHLS